MKTVTRYLDGMRAAFDGSYVSTLIKPKQVFVNGVLAYDATKEVGNGILDIDKALPVVIIDIDKALPVVYEFTLTQGPDLSTTISTIIAASDNDEVGRIYVFVSIIHASPPSATELKTLGFFLLGNTMAYNVTGLSTYASYYGLAMTVDRSGNESIIGSSTPQVLMTTPYIFINVGIICPR
jgi:hypothetical protein